jgi:pteridine reductase
MQLQNKIALVTGAAHRVGQAIALELAEAGAHLMVHYHRAETLAHETVQLIRNKGVRAHAMSADLSQADGIDALFAATQAEFGRLDVLVNSAATMDAGNVLTLTRPAWEQTLGLNLTAPFFCAQHAAQLMLAHGEGGVIINIADVSGLEPWAKYPAHSVSKAGLLMLTQVLAKALGPAIRVNAIAPGPVIKPEAWDNAHWARLGHNTLLKRTGSGYDVARAVRFLIESDYITGETLVVDGGSRFV